MELISVKQARSVWLFDVDDLNPKGKDILEDLSDWIKDTYQFAHGPNLEEVLAKSGSKDSPGLVFKHGRFQTREDLFIEISSAAIHNDGIVVDTTSSTAEGDRFIEDALKSAAKEFGLAYQPSIVRKRLYVSTLILRSRPGLLFNINPALEAFGERISETIGNTSASHFNLSSISYWTEPNDSGVHKTFTLAPQAGKPFSEGRYFSEAPVKTEDHIRLLAELEQALQG